MTTKPFALPEIEASPDAWGIHAAGGPYGFLVGAVLNVLRSEDVAAVIHELDTVNRHRAIPPS